MNMDQIKDAAERAKKIPISEWNYHEFEKLGVKFREYRCYKNNIEVILRHKKSWSLDKTRAFNYYSIFVTSDYDGKEEKLLHHNHIDSPYPVEKLFREFDRRRDNKLKRDTVQQKREEERKKQRQGRIVQNLLSKL